MDIKKIAVLGAGNGGFMSAVDMSLMGYEVAIYDSVPGKLDGVKKTGKVELCDIESKPTGDVGTIALAADHIKDAVENADVILNPVPFFAVKTYAEQAAPYINCLLYTSRCV